MDDEQREGRPRPQSPSEELLRAYQRHARVMARRAGKRRAAEQAVMERVANLVAWRESLESERRH
jgi:hypothetical protein